MRKFRLFVSMLLLVAVFLSACGAANNNRNGLEETPGAGVNETPVTGGDVDVTPTLAVTDLIDESPTVEATATAAEGAETVDATETPATGAAVDTTPTAEVPVTGIDNECNPHLLRNYLVFEVVDNTGNLMGEVDGIVIYRDSALVAGDSAGTNTGDFVAPIVAYAILDLDDAGSMGDQDVVVPLSPLTAPEANLPFVGGGSEETGATDSAYATATPADGAPYTAASPTMGVDDQGNFVETACVLIFNGDAATLQGAPLLGNDNWPDFTVDGWDEEFNNYWSTTGDLTLEFTGPNSEVMGSPVILRDSFEDIDVENANGDDIGEIEDFVIDPDTGRFQYAVLAVGGFLRIGEKFVPVPVNQVLWGSYDDEVADMGEVMINVPEGAWEQAPSFDGLNEVDFTSDTWHSDVDTYWGDLNPVQ